MSTALRELDAADVVMQELGPMTLRHAMYLAWEHTGYPQWWNIPADGATPQECMRTQLRRLAVSAPPADQGEA